MPFSISKRYKNFQWNNLKIADPKSPNWKKGIKIIEDRFNSRFFDHINLIKNDTFSGFLVMSIDCLLIETLMQFYLGADGSEDCYKGEQWKAFRDFFRYSNHFNTSFTKNQISHTFYKHFRCGLLHQAQTKEKTLIKVSQPTLLHIVDPKNIPAGLIIDRDKFHSRLEDEFKDYLNGLKNNDSNFKGQNLRTNAIKKMKIICAE